MASSLYSVLDFKSPFKGFPFGPILDFRLAFTVPPSALFLDTRTCNDADEVWSNGSRDTSNVRS